MYKDKLIKINEWTYELPKTGDMLVHGRIFISSKLLKDLDEDCLRQIENVACLPGIQKASIGMSDMHIGYGFPIGGVAAFDADENGVVSVGGVGFDGGCGVRCLKTNLTLDEVKPKIKELVDELFDNVPAGLGIRGKITLSREEVDEVLRNGAKWIIEEKKYGLKEDLEYIEENGRVSGADPKNVSETAIKREQRQVGTLGSGNHYLEVQYVDEIYDEEAAKQFGLEKNQILISIHCGSRALGHQIGTDYLKVLADASRKYNIPIREHELVCAPIKSEEGKDIFQQCAAALNYAYANRQVIAHLVRESIKKIFPKAKVETFYEITHNSCKAEKHEIDGKLKTVYVHRKGATRAYGPGRAEVPKKYREIGQPVLIGGTMGTASFIMHGTEKGMKEAFGSACHGSGRAMSRTRAKKQYWGSTLIKELEQEGVYVKARSLSGLAEEAPGAYKPVEDVVDAIHQANLAKRVVRLKPIGNIKG